MGDSEPQKLTHSRFGAYLLQLVLANLPAELVRDKSVAVVHLADRLNVDKSVIYAAIRGDLAGNKPFTPDMVKDVIRIYLGKPRLMTRAQLETWVESGLERYQYLLNDPEVITWIQQRHIPDGMRKRPGTWAGVERRQYPEQIAQGLSTKQVTLVKGAPGVGKSWLLRKIERDFLLIPQFDFIAAISDSDQPFAGAPLLQPIAWSLGLTFDHDKPQVAEAEILRLTKFRTVLLIVDDVIHPELIPYLLAHVHPQTKILASTRHSAVLAAIPAEQHTLIEIPPYSREEACEYVSHAGLSFCDQPEFSELLQKIRSNPLGLQIAVSVARSHGLREVNAILAQPPTAEHTEVSQELYQVMAMSVNMLPEALQNRFAQLGVLPFLHSYTTHTLMTLWETDQSRATDWLMTLYKDAGLVEQIEPDTWQINRQVWLYARELSRHLPKYQVWRAAGWIKRAAQAYDVRSWHGGGLIAGRQLSLSAAVRKTQKSDLAKQYSLGPGWRALRALVPWLYRYSSWETVQRYSASFNDIQYVRGYYLNKRERGLIEASAGMFWMLILSLVIKFPVWLVLFMLALMVFGFWMFFRYNRAYPLMWVWLWEKRHLEFQMRELPEQSQEP